MANEDSGVDAASLLLFPFYVAIPMAYLGFAGECDIPEILAFPVATNCCSLIYEGVRKARKNLKNNQE
jgi:hypothetical protein